MANTSIKAAFERLWQHVTAAIDAAQVHSDLSQTDETAPDYVKGVIRQESLPEGYPYEEVREVVILPETEFSTVYAGGNSRDSITVDSNFKFEDGIEYIITFNGAKYICKRSVYNEITFLGNAHISYNILPSNPFDSMDTNEPFMIFIKDSEPTTLYINTINPIDCSVSIVYDDSITHAIDYKYMPEGYPYEEIKVFDITNWEYNLSSFYNSLDIIHNKNIPFALGQVWSVYGNSFLSNNTDVYECVVQQTNDGILYIGDSELTSIPFYVTANEAAISEAFQTQFTDANTSDKVTALCLQCVSGVVTETTIYPMDEKFLPSSATAQSDWFVNDENDPAYVKNRTHYEETVVKDVDYYAGGNSKTAGHEQLSHDAIPLVLGDKYKVYYSRNNGELQLYSDELYEVLEDDSGLYIGGSSTPFCIRETVTTVSTTWNASSSGVTEIRIKKQVEENVVHHLDPKYIKDMYYDESSEVFSIENAEFTNGQYTCETPFAITDGNTYIVNWDGTEYICVAYTFEGIPAIGNTSDFGGKGNDEPFFIGYNSATNETSIGAYGDATTHTFSVVENIVHTIDYKYIKDMYYDNGSTTTVLVDNQTVTGFEVMEDPIYAVQNPFSFSPTVGATYTVTWDGTDYECTASVADGLTYIGNVNYVNMQSGGDIPFAIIFAENIFLATESTEESHTISITEVAPDMKQLDEKYLPILEEVDKTIFSMDDVISESEFEFSHGKIVGDYRVTVDGLSEDIEFIDETDYSVAAGSSYDIEIWDSIIWIGFHDGGTHSVKIEKVQIVVKEEYLPESVTTIPNWNAVEGENGYIENRTHYEDGNCVLKFTAVNNGSSYRYDFGSYGALESYRDLVQSEDTPIYVKMNDTVLETKHSFYNGYYNLYYGENNTLIQNYIGGSNSGTLTIFPKNVDPDYSADTVDICILTTSYYELKQIDEKFLPDSVKGTPDWNQGDETSPDYIKNRTHYEINDITKLEFDITGISLSDNAQNHNLNIPFALGQTWNVSFANKPDGDDLEVMEDDDGSLYIALLGVSGDSTWECYRITANECTVDNNFARVNYVDALHITGVSGEVSAVHKLDEKFLPDSVVKNGDTELILTSSTAGSTKKFRITIDDNGVLTTEEVSE